jgi:photosystem II stability/assembly factor-like uncharacterized protein/DNA-binding beta-propeller fold protein YncE
MQRGKRVKKYYPLLLSFTAVIALWGLYLSPALTTPSLAVTFGQASSVLQLSISNLPPEGAQLKGTQSSEARRTQSPISNLQSRSPDIPVIVEQLYLGVPAGNGHSPQRLVVDSQRQRLYTLNNGLSDTNAGNTISVIDLKTSQVTDLLRLETPSRPSLLAEPYESILSPPRVLDLQLDPYRPRLYALTGDLYADPPYSNLSIIDLTTLTVLNTVSGVLAIAPGPNQLYLLSQNRLWSADPNSLTELSGTNLQSPITNPPSLLFNPTTNRLYLLNSPTLQVFAATTLTLVNTYTAASELKQVVLDPTNNGLWLIENDGAGLNLAGLDSAGRPLPAPAPLTLTDDTYSEPRLALAGSTLAVTNRAVDTYSLQLLNKADLTLSTELPIPSYPTSLAADSTSGRLYLSYSNPPDYILQVDPASRASQAIFTALTIRDALADPATGRLYVLNDQGTLQVLSLATYREIARLATANVSTWNVERLALDPTRQRLYLSGNPAQVVDTETLTITATLDTPGQLTPDPASNRLYLTPPCNCRTELCNTLILDAGTLTTSVSSGHAATLFPPQEALVAPCVFATTLDEANQLLYAQIYNGVPGSNSGDYFTVFNVAGPPQELYTAADISFGQPALDPLRRRAFVPRYRMSQAFLYRFEAQGQIFTPTLQVAGAAGALTYDPTFDRLYAVTGSTLQVYDGDLALLSEIALPGAFSPLTFDPQAQRLYLTDRSANLLVVASSGGQLAPPPQPHARSSATTPPPQLFIAPGGDYFQIYNAQLYRAQNGAQPWEILGRGLPDRYVTTLAISPNFRADQTLLVALGGPDRAGSLYRSRDGGDTWQPTTRGLTDLNIKHIVFSPTFAQDNTIFVSSLSGGLYRSADGGDTWLSLAGAYTTDPASAQVSDMAVSPNFASDGLVLISAGTLRRSSDGGNSWQDTGLPAGLLAFSPNFARDGLILSEGRWRSSDGGQSWQPAAAGLAPNRGAVRLFFSPNFTTDQTVYLLAAQDYDEPYLLQRSNDAGRAWQTLLGGLPPNFKLAAATLLPNGNLYLSPSQGQALTLAPQQLTWGRSGVDPTQLDWQDLAVGPEGALYVANSTAGVLKSLDGGRTWQDTNFPARADETSEAKLASANNGTLFAAIGPVVERSADGGQSWTYLSQLPPGFGVTALAVSPTFAPDGIVLVGGDYRAKQILRSSDGGQTWQVVFDGSQRADYSDVSAFAFSPNFATDRTVYAWLQYAGLLRSSDGGQSWTVVPSDKSSIFAQALLVAPTGLYVGALGGGLYATADGGQSWQDLTANIPGNRQWSRALAFGPGNSLFLGADIGIYRTQDGGQTWSQASTGLPLGPDSPGQGVRALRFSGQRLYAALVNGGIFVSTDQGQSWHSSATAPPAASPTPACAMPPANFAGLWANRVGRLGCPTTSRRVVMVEQSFAGGLMFWRSDSRTIYALPLNQPYSSRLDTWNESQPLYGCPEFGPPQTPPTPQRGFGQVWCTQPQVRQGLGQATSLERSFEALLQEFTTGLIWQTDQGIIYILEGQSNGWEEVQ